MEILAAEIWTDDLDRQVRFYHDVLGLPVERRTQTTAGIQAGKTHLVLHQANETLSGHYHFAFDVPENQFTQAYAWLEQRVQPSANASGTTHFRFTHWNSDSVYFKDQDGNILELIARHNRSNTSEIEFSARDILSVSEFGIATSTVRQTVDQLCEELSIEPYDGAGSEEFTAVGDEFGLLIVVRHGRIWMPGTGKDAEYVPFRLKVGNGQGKVYEITAPAYPLEITPG